MTTDAIRVVHPRSWWTPDNACSLMRGAGFEPLEPYPGKASVKWLCRCTRCGKESTPRASRVKQGAGCYYCGRNAVSVARRTPEPAAVAEMEQAGLTPLAPYPDAENPWLCRCQKCGREVTPRLVNIRKGWGGCKHCRLPGGKPRLDPGEAALNMREAGLDPLEPYRTSVTKWRCRCMRCGREVTPLYSNIRQGSGGCPHCATHQFDRVGPALVYSYHHPALRAVKVGVTSDFKRQRRTSELKNGGWRQLRTWLCVPGENALVIEKGVLATLRARCGKTPFLTASDMPMGGHTETFDALAVTPAELVETINQIWQETAR